MKQIYAIVTALFVVLASCTSAPSDELGVTIGVQTYSFRTQEDESPLAILEYIKETGIKHVELMGNHAEPFAGAPASPMDDPAKRAIMIKQWRQQELTEEEAELAVILREEMTQFNADLAKWRSEVDYSKFEELRELYAANGISIYAFKPSVFGKNNTDEDIRYGMRAAKALGANHVTVEHPEDDEHTARLGKIAEEEGILMAYHGHMQQTPTLWDTALEQSSGNSMNLDFGHYIAAENENPLQIIKDKHASIASMHLKDRQKKSNGGGNLMWGTGDTPIAEVVTLIRDNGYTFPITVELEYEIPEGSDAVQEVKRSFEYIKNILKP
ncbi:MAG: sugar phosphate isomerase/epimerase [Flavobacteriaceae bacterium]